MLGDSILFRRLAFEPDTSLSQKMKFKIYDNSSF